jgi:hypothetical protein
MRRWMAWLALGLLAVPGNAGPIGNAFLVHPDVYGYGAGGSSREIRKNDSIERGLRVQLRGQDASLVVAFNFGGCTILTGPQSHQFTGTASLAGVSEVNFGDPADPNASWIRLNLGKMHLALLPKAGCPLEIHTPQVKRVLVGGTYLRMLVDPVVGTFIAVDEGTVTVEAEAGGSAIKVTAGNWVLVPPGGLPTRPTPLPPGDDDEILQDPPLLGCCTGTEPPKPPPSR